MKRMIALFAALILALELCACTANQLEDQGAEESQGLTWQEQYDLGVRYLSEGNYQEAILAFTAAIEIDLKRAPAYMGRGDAYVKSGETEENLAAAKADYETTIGLDETIVEAYLGLANVYIWQGDYDQALETLQKGYKITCSQNLLDAIERTENQIMYREDAWIFTDNVVHANELTLDGVPFWKVKIERVAEIFPSDDSGEDCSWFSDDSGIQYTQMINRRSEVTAIQENKDTGLSSISYTVMSDYDELRQIRFDISRTATLQKLGLTDKGLALCASFDFGKVLRFVCKEGIWIEDIECAGSISSGSEIEFIWPNHKSDQELILSLYFDGTDSLERIVYHFMDLGY